MENIILGVALAVLFILISPIILAMCYILVEFLILFVIFAFSCVVGLCVLCACGVIFIVESIKELF